MSAEDPGNCAGREYMGIPKAKGEAPIFRMPQAGQRRQHGLAFPPGLGQNPWPGLT